MNLIPVPMTGGVNLFMDPRRIRDDELVRAKNLVPTNPGLLQKRGVAEFRTLIDLDPLGNPSAFTFGNLPLFDFGFTFSDPDTSTAILYAGTVASPSMLTTAIPYVNDWRPLLIPFANKLYCFPGHVPDGSFPAVGKVVQEKSSGGLEIADFNWSTTQTVARSPRVAAPYKNRMVYGNFGPGYENTITFSDPEDPAHVNQDFLATNGRSFRLPVPASDPIVGMVEISQTAIGTLMESALLVLCNFSAFLLTGETLRTDEVPDGSSYSGSLKVNRVNEPCGCVSQQTIVRTQYGVVWTGPDDVWMMNTGTVPTRVGTKIRPALERTPSDRRYLMHAEYHGGFYRVATAGDGQVVEVHGRLEDQWWLDLRGGTPQDWSVATWWGPQTYLIPQQDNVAPSPGTYVMARDQRPGHPYTLYAITRALGTGGAVDQPVIVELDTEGTYDSGYSDDDAPVREDGNEVAMEILTKEYDYAAVEQPAPLYDKLWLGAEVSLWAGEMCRLTGEVIIGRESDSDSINVEQSGFILGVDDLDSAKLTREWQSVLVPRDPDNNFVGKTYQFRLYDEPGWPVFEGGLMNYFIATDATGVDLKLYRLTPGFYTGISDFLDELCTQLNELVSGATHNQNITARPKVEITSVDPCVWAYKLDSPEYIEADGARSTRAIAAKLGFDDTDQTTTTPPDNLHTAGEYVRNKLCAPLAIGGIVLRVEPFGRSPS